MAWYVAKADMRDLLPMIARESVDSIVCDPPYGLSKEPDVVEVLEHWIRGDDYEHGSGGFMGKKWDSFVPGPSYWRACYDALKPGGYLLAFGGTRTYDLMVVAIRMAGFEVRDQLQWLFGSGFPKSLDVSKAIETHASALTRSWATGAYGTSITDAAQSAFLAEIVRRGEIQAEHNGAGTALKPGHEPIVLARKPFKGTVAANVLEHGTGGLNVDGCRIEGGERPLRTNEISASGLTGTGGASTYGSFAVRGSKAVGQTLEGRWPANVVMDEDAAAELDAQTGELVSGANPTRRGSDKLRGVYGEFAGQAEAAAARGVDRGGASRFYYCAKASSAERSLGLPDGQKNRHATVKPIALMRYLCRLVTRPGGLVVDPFCGSGTTGCAAELEGLDFVGIDLDDEGDENVETSRYRIAYWEEHR